ncbi:uncharacterized protein LOC142014909 isoform X4 [Carettochelys insculpta]|uniref:uncharacterized protein LOC142014909 isoform X4 n=1 Tax=Carettochelys insculpta TaxID=44489 RepID=UPI003EB8A4A1
MAGRDTRMFTGMSEGQRNQGFTCYLDSLPQCLFFTPEFREAILSWNNAGDSHIMAPFKSQFEMLTTDNSLTEETIIQWLKAEVCNTWDWCQECRANQVLSVCKGGAQPHSSSFMQPGACSKPHCLGISERSENVTNPRQNVQVQLDIMKCFQLVMSKISEDKEEIQQVETVQAPTYHGGRNLMVLEKCTLKCSSFLDKCTPGPVYSVRSCFETVPQMLFIHLKKDQVVGSRADVPGLLTLNLEAEEQLDANYELFAACYHSKGIQEDWNVTEIKLPGNGFFYWVSDTEVQKVSGQPASTTPGSRYCSGMGNSAAVSLLLYHKVKSDARPSRYVGLQNQGSTCYLNSLLQCLFFTPELSKSILSCENVPDSSIVCQLKKLFDKLNHKKSAPSTENITRCLGVTNVHQQQDVAEYFRILMNKIIDDKQEIQKMYQVEMVHSITCQKCQKETKIKENPVLSLSLSLYQWTSKQEAYSVARALDDVQKINYFTGDEQLYCETCKSKEDAESRYRFETLPPILVLVLKRYRFGGDGFRKLHCNVSAPLALHVKLDHTQSSQIINYELFAVCHHQGGIHGGHYVAEIKPFKSDCWYYFNDTTVTEAPEEQNTMGTKNSHTAYLLMYRSENSAVCQVQSNPGNPDAAEPSNVILATKDEALEPALSLFDAGKGTSGAESYPAGQGHPIATPGGVFWEEADRGYLDLDEASQTMQGTQAEPREPSQASSDMPDPLQEESDLYASAQSPSSRAAQVPLPDGGALGHVPGDGNLGKGDLQLHRENLPVQLAQDLVQGMMAPPAQDLAPSLPTVPPSASSPPPTSPSQACQTCDPSNVFVAQSGEPDSVWSPANSPSPSPSPRDPSEAGGTQAASGLGSGWDVEAFPACLAGVWNPGGSSSPRDLAGARETPAALALGDPASSSSHQDLVGAADTLGALGLASPLAGPALGTQPGLGNPSSLGTGIYPACRALPGSSSPEEPAGARATQEAQGLPATWDAELQPQGNSGSTTSSSNHEDPPGAGDTLAALLHWQVQPWGYGGGLGIRSSPGAGNCLGCRAPPGSSSPEELAGVRASQKALELPATWGAEPQQQLQPQGNSGSTSSSSHEDPAGDGDTLTALGLGVRSEGPALGTWPEAGNPSSMGLGVSQGSDTCQQLQPLGPSGVGEPC